MVVEDEKGNRFHALGRPSGGGGMWGRWFCERCNGATGRWEEEYIAWGLHVLLELQRQKPSAGQVLGLDFEDADPGAFGRMLWAWMFAVDDALRAEVPDIAHSVLSGVAVEPPAELRVLVGATTDLRLWLVGQRDGVAMQSAVGGGGWRETSRGLLTTLPEDVPLPRVAISAPPLVVLLAEAGHDPRVPYFDASAWLLDPAGQRRSAAMLLPVVRPFDAEEPVTLVTYEQLA